ncbi:6-bladed beta-propeller [candidate division KSB1 bacterium]
MHSKGCLYYILITLLIFIACSGGEPTYTVEEIEGVRYVHNISPLWGDEQKIRLELVRKIGELEGRDENYQLYLPRDIAIDKQENIYILDDGGHSVKKFDSDARFITSFGEQGQGPGELSSASSIDIGPDGNLFIGNSGNSRIDIFDPDGNYLKSITRQDRSELSLGLIMLDSGEFILNSPRTDDDFPDISTQPIAYKYDPEGNKIAMFGERKSYEDDFLNITGNQFYAASDRKNNCYITLFARNSIEKYSPEGRLLLKIDRVLPFEESISPELTYASVGRATIGIMTFNYFSTGIHIDQKERMWIFTYLKQSDEEFIGPDSAQGPNIRCLEVYNSDGILLTRITPDFSTDSYDLKLIHNDRLYFIERENEMAVFEYRIIGESGMD